MCASIDSSSQPEADAAQVSDAGFGAGPVHPQGLAFEPVAGRSSDGPQRMRFEFPSRGDFVPGLILLPSAAREPAPLVLLQHGAGGSKESDYLEAARLPWVRAGAAVATIDFPLHGERASAKLTERLLGSVAASDTEGLDPNATLLWDEFAVQSVADLRGLLAALGARPEVDGERIAYAGFSLGAIVGAFFVAAEPRVRAAALALGGGGLRSDGLDPVHWIGRVAPRPLLLLNATRDERIPREAAEALHAAAGDPKEIHWVESGHADIGGRALKTMWQFLARELGLAP